MNCCSLGTTTWFYYLQYLILRYCLLLSNGWCRVLSKNLLRGALLDAVLLGLIHDASSHGLHGYALLLMIEKQYGVRLGPSTVYPELKVLERRGLIVSRWDFTSSKARCLYRITNKGQNLLKTYSVQLRLVVPTLLTQKSSFQRGNALSLR